MEKANYKKIQTLVNKYLVRLDKTTLRFILTTENANELINIIPKYFDNAIGIIEYDFNYGSNILKIKSKTRKNIFFTIKIEERN